MFKRDFAHVVYDGDGITCHVDGFDCVATLHRDEDSGPPDKMQDGFWPSRDPKDAGYIGKKSKAAFEREYAYMNHVHNAWLRDEWHYYGVSVTVSRAGVQLTGDYDHALWGIEGNWPARDKRKNPNAYFRDVANDYLPQALEAARKKLSELCEKAS